MDDGRSTAKGVCRTQGKGISPSYMPLSVGLLVCLFALALTGSVEAVVFNVAAPRGRGDVYGPNGLVEAIKKANRRSGFDEIVLEPGVYTLTRVDNRIDGPNGLPTITSALTISTVVDPRTSPVPRTSPAIIERSPRVDLTPFRIIHVSSFPAALFLINVVVRGGDAGPGDGGGLFNRGSTTVLINSTVSDNKARRGGGIFNSAETGSRPGDLSIANSMVSGNHANTGGGIFNQGALTIARSTISDNQFVDELSQGGTNGGGGITNDGGTAILERSTISNNTATGGGRVGGGGGGGIDNVHDGTLTIRNSTISGNKVMNGNFSSGGGNSNNGTTFLNNVTIANNTVARGGDLQHGGGISNEAGTFTMANSIVVGNSARSGPQCSGTITSLGFNLMGREPGTGRDPLTGCNFMRQQGDHAERSALTSFRLEPLENNGGLTKTHALVSARNCFTADEFVECAIDKGNPAAPGSSEAACELVDQRGFPRPFGRACDIGAFESPVRILNNMVTQPLIAEPLFDPTPVPGGPEGTFTIRPTFTNASPSSINNPIFEVLELSGGNLLLNADGGPDGVGARLTLNVGADGVLLPGESFTANPVIGLQTRERFTFFVNLLGAPTP